MNKFTINGRTYIAKEFDFDMVCDLEEMGIPSSDYQKKSSATLRAYFSLCSGIDISLAGKEIHNHLKNGGSLDELSNCFIHAVETSDFFQTTEEDTTENVGTSKAKKAEK